MSTEKTGFTLIELIVIIVVIAVLIGIALPQYKVTMERSRQSEAMVNLGAIRGSQLRHFAESDVYIYDPNWVNLDIDQPQGKFFSYSLPIGNANTATCVARALRLTVATAQNPGYGAYTIDMDSAGILTKTPSTIP